MPRVSHEHIMNAFAGGLSMQSLSRRSLRILSELDDLRRYCSSLGLSEKQAGLCLKQASEEAESRFSRDLDWTMNRAKALARDMTTQGQ